MSDTRPPATDVAAAAGTWPARGLTLAVRLYQAVRAGRPSPCRFWPTCSAYALDALSEYGAARGGWMAARRVARCHPWGGHGVDPVPLRGARVQP